MKWSGRNLFLLVSGLVLSVVLLLGTPFVQAQSSRWFGSPGSPFWNKTWQGDTIKYGKITCGTASTTFLTSNSNYRQSLILRNVSDADIQVCPAGVEYASYAYESAGTTSTGGCNAANGFVISPGEALVLDKSNRAAASTGWKCFAGDTDKVLHYIAEEGF